MAYAPIFDIQRFSIHDGPGLRTVVFLKGCPLRCAWCSNPESQAKEREILFDAKRCVHCRACLAPAFGGALREVEGHILPDRSRPLPEGLDAVCPSLAIRVAGRDMEAADLIAEVAKDEAFFRRSGGGLTFSGGEPLLHPDFLLDCTERAEALGIPVAIETCLAVGQPPLKALLAHGIHWLLDVKHVDAAAFKAGTGGELGMVLGNMALIAAASPTVTFRIPLIPGFNDSGAARDGIFDFIAGLERPVPTPPEVHILPFHNLAAGKYSHLGRDYAYAGSPKLGEAVLEAWKRHARERGFAVAIGG
jgi:pyruvate formate lyase activating enzyme